MKIIADERCTGYSHPGHPERPERISRTIEKLRTQTDVPITWAKPVPAPDEALLRAHTADHIARLNDPHDFDTDTPWFPKIADYPRASAGAALEALKAALAAENVFSLLPPAA